MQQFRPNSLTAKKFVAIVSKSFEVSSVTQEIDRILDSYDISDIVDTWLVHFEAHIYNALLPNWLFLRFRLYQAPQDDFIEMQEIVLKLQLG
jgi:hypothetical protein